MTDIHISDDRLKEIAHEVLEASDSEYLVVELPLLRRVRDETLKAVMAWGDTHCTTHYTRMQNVLKRECQECWRGLAQAAEEVQG